MYRCRRAGHRRHFPVWTSSSVYKTVFNHTNIKLFRSLLFVAAIESLHLTSRLKVGTTVFFVEIERWGRTEMMSNVKHSDRPGQPFMHARKRMTSTSSSLVVANSERDLITLDVGTCSQGPAEMRKMFKRIIAVHFGYRMRLHNILNGNATSDSDSIISFAYRTVAVLMIAFSTLVFVIQSMPQFYDPEVPFAGDFFTCETIVVAYFSFDFVLRILSARSSDELLSAGMAIDFISFAGYYVEQIINAAGAYPNNQTGFTLIRLLRLARITRLLRLSRSQRGLSMLWEVVLKSKDGLFLLVVLCSIATIVFASILYYIEIVSCVFDAGTKQWYRPDGTATPFQSIPHTFWFIAMTITTVGYGDQIPGNLGGRAWTIVVMLFGVLVLSFPNILIGSNFADVSRRFSREKSRGQLGRMFRKVRMAVRLVRLWREFRVKGRIDYDVASESCNNDKYRVNILTKTSNFIFRISDFPERPLHDTPEKVAQGNLDAVVHCGVSLQNYLQRVLEGYSGTATIEELTQGYHFFPHKEGIVTNGSVFELTVRAAATGLVHFFVLNRDLETGVVHLARKGADALQNFPESNVMPCMRCYIEARDIWMQTAKLQPSDFLPMDGYRNWQSVQGRTRRRSGADFVYDLKNPDSTAKNNIFKGIEPRKLNTSNSKARCRCRYCNTTWGLDSAMRPEHDTCFKPDAEFLEMEITYAQNALTILMLEQKLKTLQKGSKSAASNTAASAPWRNRSPSNSSLKPSPEGSGVFNSEDVSTANM